MYLWGLPHVFMGLSLGINQPVALPQAGCFGPGRHQALPGGRVPILFQVRMAFRAFSHPAVMAKAAFERLQAAGVQLTALLIEKGTAGIGKLLEGKVVLAAFESR